MTTGGGKARRFGGRWIREGEQYEDRHRALRAVLRRFWYLLVPFLGIMWAHDTYVRPYVEDIKSLTNRERKTLLDNQADIRAEVSGIQSEIQTVSSEIDTLYLPQVKLYRAINDSLIKVRTVYDQTLPETKARIDSLHVEHDAVVAEIDQLQATLEQRLGTLNGLKTWHATLQDSIEALDELTSLMTDELYRLVNPEEYRRREAMFTGQGEYPRRDENPRREGGQ
ncbi:MAG: hypothetical protein KAY24_17850 [Candidatus Eisenbacteria sp.]|nr:hypothetical protein [Candidatus Eisenbacteria bacterium]